MPHAGWQFENSKSSYPKLRRGRVPMVTAAGRASGNAFYVQTAYELARQLPCPCIEVSGHHLSYTTDASVFADELHHIIETLKRA
jgi:hypothetical protein